MSKHTPAPWTVDVLDDVTNIEASHQTICTNVSNCDADVIAAAPDMLLALERISVMLSAHRSNDYDFMLTLITPALSKARGGK